MSLIKEAWRSLGRTPPDDNQTPHPDSLAEQEEEERQVDAIKRRLMEAMEVVPAPVGRDDDDSPPANADMWQSPASSLYARNGMDVASDDAIGDRRFGDYNSPVLPANWQGVDQSDPFIAPRRARAVDAARAADAIRDFATYVDPANNNVFYDPMRQHGQQLKPAGLEVAANAKMAVDFGGAQMPQTTSQTVAWSSVAPADRHRNFIDRQPGIKDAQKAVENRAKFGIDEQQDSQYPHAMRLDDGVNPVESPAEARSRINAWVRFNLERAWAHKDAKNSEASQYYLGLAKHAKQDLTSPAHNDANMDPSVWTLNGDTWGHIQHGMGELFDPGPNSWAQRATDDVQSMFEHRYIPKGDLTRMYGVDQADGPANRPGQLPRPAFPAKPYNPPDINIDDDQNPDHAFA